MEPLLVLDLIAADRRGGPTAPLLPTSLFLHAHAHTCEQGPWFKDWTNHVTIVQRLFYQSVIHCTYTRMQIETSTEQSSEIYMTRNCFRVLRKQLQMLYASACESASTVLFGLSCLMLASLALLFCGAIFFFKKRLAPSKFILGSKIKVGSP